MVITSDFAVQCRKIVQIIPINNVIIWFPAFSARGNRKNPQNLVKTLRPARVVFPSNLFIVQL